MKRYAKIMGVFTKTLKDLEVLVDKTRAEKAKQMDIREKAFDKMQEAQAEQLAALKSIKAIETLLGDGEA